MSDREMTRNERILNLSSFSWVSMSALSRLLDCPEASIRRSIQELRKDGYYVVLDQGQVRSFGKRAALIAQDPSENIQSPSENVGGDNDADYQK